MAYIELHASSAFSFLDGASLPEALVERAASLGYPALALLDRDGFYGSPRFHLAAKRAGLKAIVGAELTIGLGTGTSVFRLPVLVESRDGYRNLSRLVTRMKRRSPKGEGALALEELDGHVAGLVALVGRTAMTGPRFGVGGLVDRIVGTFGAPNVCIEVQRHLLRDEEADNQALVDLASAFHVPVVATNGVRFAEPADRPLYDALTCIRHKTTLERAGRRLTWNAERYLKPPDAMARLFSDMPKAVAASGELADRLGYTMADLGYRFPEYPVPAGETMASFLRKIAQAGARERYRPYHERARRQIQRELDLIEKLDLAGYFLIVWDIVNFCRQHDILVQGRGSAANSAVCYSLGITAVDPVGMDLLFERFLSEERGEWPDIDLDLPSGDRRERVIQHMYEKYRGEPSGGPRIAMTANVITYRGRSAAREVGKVLSLEPAQIDRLAKVMNHFEWVDPKDTLERNLREVGLDFQHPVMQTFGRLWTSIQDLPRHLGQHSGGMVMCQGRLDDVVPLENATMPNRVVVQWDKDDCADMGIVKVDLLGLGMMSVLQDALELVNQAGSRERLRPAPKASLRVLRRARVTALSATSERSESRPRRLAGASRRRVERVERGRTRYRMPLDLAHLPPDDPAVYRMLQEADTIGIFQVESRAQMATLPRLRPGVLLRHRRRGRDHPSRPDRGADGAPVLETPSGSGARDLRAPLARADPRAHARRAAVPGAAAPDGDGRGGVFRRRSGGAAARVRVQAIRAPHAAARGPAARRDGEAADYRRGGGRDSPVDHLVCALRVSGVTRRELRAARVRQRVFESALPGGLLHGAPEQPADGVLPSGHAREGRAAPRRAVRADRRAGVRLDLPRRSRRPCPAGTDVCERPAAGNRQGDRRCRTAAVREPANARISLELRPPELDASCSDRCPKCGCDDQSMLEETPAHGYFCNICAHEWNRQSLIPNPSSRNPGESRDPESRSRIAHPDPGRYASIDDLVARVRLRRDELATLAEIGALNAFGHDRRSALWQIERAVRPAGELFDGHASSFESADPGSRIRGSRAPVLR